MSDKILKEAFDKLTAIEEATSPEEEQINVLTLRMRRATEEDDEAAYKRAVDQLNALTDKMQSEQPIDEDRSDAADGAEELTGIQEELFEIIERLDSAIRAYVPRKHAYWQSYGLAQLKIVAGSDEYATSDESINNLIEVLSDEMNHGDDDNFDDDIDEGKKLERLARKVIPGYGKHVASERGKDYGYSGNLDAGYAEYHGDENVARQSRNNFKARRKYNKIAGKD